ncbi:MAG: type III pantothenate kinase [Lachnospiraceae bacterium]|nr:type III pantothenate kinase [Lachnospiraceae bacterium]
MLLAIDMGNTNIEVGVIDDDTIHFTERISTDIDKTELEYAVILKTVMEIHGIAPADIDGSIISSVVPPLTHIMKQAVRKLVKKINPMVVGSGLKTGLNIKMDDPRTMGADLVVDSVAAMTEYGAPSIVVDMGTATTITVIDRDKNYIGGVIMPGVRTSLEALVSDTSQLPRVSLSAPKHYICTNTVDCMKSGIINGQASLVDGMIERFEEELGYKTTVVATGGLSKVIIPKCRHEIILDNALMMKGLKVIYDRNKPKT